MENTSIIYQPEKQGNSLILTPEQKEAIRQITLGIEEVDETIREMAIDDVAETLENGHSLNRLITDQDGNLSGYVACENFVPNEAYIKYFGATEKMRRNIFSELPAFFEYAKQKGYSKLNFHGWNPRLNHALERFGFQRLRTDSMGGFSADFYEKILSEQKTREIINEERKKAFELKYINKLKKEYEQTLKTFKDDNRREKEQRIIEAFNILNERFSRTENFEFNERQKITLKLKLARHFQNNDTCDANTLYDALIETPKFINTDKGSLYRLFEIHEQKTLEKIAQMRKKRAEIGAGEDFNPYEALCRTESGNYYLARLLNMPHLEEESEYMRHCVGTSDSYINKIKRGDVEILSFRNIPQFNPETKKMDVDTPIMTIEYNLKTKVIEQMKKADDGYLNPDDPYYEDVIDALKELRTTKTDMVGLRDFSKINSSELDDIKVKDYCLLTEHGEVNFKDFDPEKNIFVLKMGKMEITEKISKEDAVKLFQIVEKIKLQPEEIAYGEKEISEKTKAYIGPLFKGLFQYDFEHIYTSFPEGRIEKGAIEIGGQTKDDLKNEIKSKKDDQGRNYEIYSYAESMMDNPDFEKQLYENTDAPREQWILKKPEQIGLIKLKVKDFGFAKNPTTDELYKKAGEFGLELCPAETGPQLRLKYEEVLKREQPLNEYLRVAMKQISDSDGDPGVFNVRRYGDGKRILRNDWAKPSSEWGDVSGFVFRLRK
jgi:hypothetical protein